MSATLLLVSASNLHAWPIRTSIKNLENVFLILDLK